MPYTDSDPEGVTLTLQGVWIHDPATGGQESARWYPYGASQRAESLSVLGESTYYAGRTDPVTDYGEHEDASLSVVVDVPHGVTWRGDIEDLRCFATNRRVVHLRDNRGRSTYGTLEGFQVRDMDWGSQVSFTIERRAWPVAEVPA